MKIGGSVVNKELKNSNAAECAEEELEKARLTGQKSEL
jgi:hypothetical protein